MDSSKKVKLIESLILLNTYNYEECRQKIEQYLEEEEFLYYKILLKILDLFELITISKDIRDQILEIHQLISEIEEDNWGTEFKKLVNQILQDLESPYLGFPRKKFILNWQVFI